MSHSPSFSQPHSQTGGSRADGQQLRTPAQPPRRGTRIATSRTTSNAGAAAAGAGAANRNQSSNTPTPGPRPPARRRQPQPVEQPLQRRGRRRRRRRLPTATSRATIPTPGPPPPARVRQPQPDGQLSQRRCRGRRRGLCQPQPEQLSQRRRRGRRRGYANRNQYDQYHPGMADGYWNGNYGTGAVGAYGGMGMASPCLWLRLDALHQPLRGRPRRGRGRRRPAGSASRRTTPRRPPRLRLLPAREHGRRTARAGRRPTRRPRPSPRPARPSRRAITPTRSSSPSRRSGRCRTTSTLHEFLALVLFAQGNYEQAAAPLYAVLSVGPGWDWTTLIGNYSDAEPLHRAAPRPGSLRAGPTPRRPQARFVLAYHYISQGHGDAATKPLKDVVALQPNDTLSAQLLGKLQPAARRRRRGPGQAQPSTPAS